MLKSCPSCSYIGNDGEHVCPFCKADLAVGRPRRAADNEYQTMRIVRLTRCGGARNTSVLPLARYHESEISGFDRLTPQIDFN